MSSTRKARFAAWIRYSHFDIAGGGNKRVMVSQRFGLAVYQRSRTQNALPDMFGCIPGGLE